MRKFILLLLFAAPLAAQTVTVGSQPRLASLGYSSSPPYTLVDLSHPANADGSLTSASVRWSGTATGCTSAFKIKFLRPSGGGLSAFTLVDERGPFTALPGIDPVALNPPVSVKKGDLIAITSLVSPASCGSPYSMYGGDSVGINLPGDVTSGNFSNGLILRNQALGLRATDTSEVLEGVITAAGSLPGANGSFFRTSLQIVNPLSGGTMTGKIVYHPAGVAASPSDQAIPYTITGVAGVYYDDIVQHMGKSGLGTIDVISNDGRPPLVTARVYNDGGPLGTSGFTEEMITHAEAIHAFSTAMLVTPGDLTRFRVNIGVRTFSADTTITVQYGNRSQSTKTYPANTFQQFTLAGFGDTSPSPNEVIYIGLSSGEAVVYMSVTDNITNDSAISFARAQ